MWDLGTLVVVQQQLTVSRSTLAASNNPSFWLPACSLAILLRKPMIRMNALLTCPDIGIHAEDSVIQTATLLFTR